MTEDIICELNLSPRFAARVIGQVVKSNSSSNNIQFPSAGMTGGEIPTKENRHLAASTDISSESSEISVDSNATEGSKDTIGLTSIEKPIDSCTNQTNKSDSFNTENLNKISETNGRNPTEGVFVAESVIVSDDLTPKLQSNAKTRVLKMTPFKLRTQSSFEGSPSPVYDSWINRYGSLKPLYQFNDFNRTSYEEGFTSKSEMSCTTDVSSIEFINFKHEDSFDGKFSRTSSSEIEFNSSSPLPTPDLVKMDYDSSVFSTTSGANAMPFSSEVSTKINMNLGDIDLLESPQCHQEDTAESSTDDKNVLSVSTIEIDDNPEKSSVTIVEVEDGYISPNTNSNDDSNQPIVSEDNFIGFPPETSSLTIVEVENEDFASPENHEENQTEQSEQSMIGDDVETDALPIPATRRKKSLTDLDDSFVEWLQDRGFKVVDDSAPVKNEQSNEKKNRLSWEFLFDDDQESVHSQHHASTKNTSDDFQTFNSTTSNCEYPIYDSPTNNKPVNPNIETNFSESASNDLLISDMSADKYFPATPSSADNEARDIKSSPDMKIDALENEKEHKAFLANQIADAENISLKNELEIISLSFPTPTEKKETSQSYNGAYYTEHVNNNTIIIEFKDVEKSESLEDQAIPKSMSRESLITRTQTSSITEPNGEENLELQEDLMKPNKPLVRDSISEGCVNFQEVGYNADTFKPSFILDAYENESSFSQHDSRLTSMELDKYPEASWLALELEDNRTPEEKVKIEEAISKVSFPSFTDDLHSIALENASCSNELSVIQTNNQNTSLSFTESNVEVGRKKWKTTEVERFEKYSEEDVILEASVDTIRRKIEEARRSSICSSIISSVHEKEESSTQLIPEDSVFREAHSDKESISYDIVESEYYSEVIVPTPPPRPSLSNEPSIREPEVAASATYCENILDTSWTSEEEESLQKPVQLSTLVYEDVDLSRKLNNEEPESLPVQQDTHKPHDVVEVPEKLVCICPRLSGFSTPDSMKRLDPVDYFDDTPPLSAQEEAIISTEPTSPARHNQEEILPHQPSEDTPNKEAVPESSMHILGPNSTQVQCPHCKFTVVTETAKKRSLTFACCILPIFVDSMKDVEHWCPECRSLIGRYTWKPFQKKV